jgi:hypothetical protein
MTIAKEILVLESQIKNKAADSDTYFLLAEKYLQLKKYNDAKDTIKTVRSEFIEDFVIANECVAKLHEVTIAEKTYYSR